MKRPRLRNKTWTDYIWQRRANPDNLWKGQEKWLYFKYSHQNWIIPMVIVSIIIFFTNPPIVNIAGIIAINGMVLFYCHIDNITSLDNNPSIVKSRLWHIEYRKKNGIF